ncbi:MAG: hypothetical protein HY319_01230 [Armatimonadetes bacterium]|nr:hypothetical protein [Armatimonadota bacterium]
MMEILTFAGRNYELLGGRCSQQEPLRDLITTLGAPAAPYRQRLDGVGALSRQELVELAGMLLEGAPPALKPGLDYVPRRLVGMLFLAPWAACAPLLGWLWHLLALAFRPHSTMTRDYRFRRTLRGAYRFAFHDDFRAPHWLAFTGTAAGYMVLIGRATCPI